MDLGWTSDIEKVHDDVSCKSLEMKEYVQSESSWTKAMSRSRTKMALSFAAIRSKRTAMMVEERIWTFDSQFASKIVLQPLEPDTDAQLHKERVISVRKEAEFVSRVLFYKNDVREWNVDTLETSCQCDDEEFQEMIKVTQKTAVAPQVQRWVQMTQTMTRRQGPEHADARVRADSTSVARCSDADFDRRSAVARCDVADLEPTTDELERPRLKKTGRRRETGGTVSYRLNVSRVLPSHIISSCTDHFWLTYKFDLGTFPSWFLVTPCALLYATNDVTKKKPETRQHVKLMAHVIR